VSVARGPKLLSVYTVEQGGFVFREYWQTGSFKACQTAFRTEFVERRSWKDDIKIYGGVINLENVDWIDLTQDKGGWRAVLNYVVTTRVS